MSKKELASLQFNNVSWKPFHLGEHVLLLQGPGNIEIEEIHESSRLVKSVLGDALTDIVPSYDAITLFYKSDFTDILEKLSKAKPATIRSSGKLHTKVIPVCYEMGIDLKVVAKHAQMNVEEIVESHLNSIYRVVLIGFTPGFIYMDGLDEKLTCPRKLNPRKRIEAGSIGIGGGQTGIYSLDSPGGWNIIGRTPLLLFNRNKKQPLDIEPGTTLSFSRISQKEFSEWEN